jgi:putative transposase
MRTRKSTHLKTFDYVGLYRYFLTFCTANRHPHFVDSQHVDVVLGQVLRAAVDTDFAIVAYCFMPDHVHLLIEARSEASDCLRFIKRAKQFSGYHFRQRFGLPLWQRYGYEHVLRDDEETLGIARYILENPLRAGLVGSIEQYPFVGSTMYSVREILEAMEMRPAGNPAEVRLKADPTGDSRSA